MVKEEQSYNLLRRLLVYDCSSFQKRKEAQEFLEEAGAIINDYRFLLKEGSVIFWYSLRIEPKLFKQKILNSKYSVLFISKI